MLNIVGGGLTGCAIASYFPGSVIWEKEKIGGLCRDNANFQEFVHILHTENREVWDFFNKHTRVRKHRTIFKAFVKGELWDWPPQELTTAVVNNCIDGYSRKMWLKEVPREAKDRIKTSKDGYFFNVKYEGVPDFSKLFANLTAKSIVENQHIRDGDLTGCVVLTGAIDDYFHYKYGHLPYRGMRSTHYQSEIRLAADVVTFSDEKIPFQRLVDYKRLGYGDVIGVESACDASHYPVRTAESEAIYEKYKQLADSKGVLLAGRLATYHYQDMDKCVEQALELVKYIKTNELK